MAALLDVPGRADYEQRLEQAETEIDNLRAAFGWSRENRDAELALALASSLQPLWLTRGRILEGRAWFDTILNEEDARHREVAAAVRARALADQAILEIFVGDSMDQAQQALAIARELDDPALLARALTACGYVAGTRNGAEVARPYFAEALGLARAIDDRWRLSQILALQANLAVTAGDPIAARAAAEEGRDLADVIGDRSGSRECRQSLGFAQLMEGDLAGAVAQFRAVAAEADPARDVFFKSASLMGLGIALAYQGEVSAARAAGGAALEAAAELGDYFVGLGYVVLALAALSAGDVAAANQASEAVWQHLSVAQPQLAVAQRAFNATEVALANGDLMTARRWADDAVAVATGWYRVVALTAGARVTIAEGEPVEAERDAHDALACAGDSGVYLPVPDILECLASLARGIDNHQAARLFGAADAIRQRMDVVRFQIHQAGYNTSVRALREAMGDNDFDAAWAEGAALSIDDAIAYAQRGRGERKRPASGWASLTPAERDVVRLVSEGLGNKDIATRLFVSPRTVQAHLTHVYTKLGLTSRVQLAQEAARHTGSP
jgi:DNA-binding CsgD family transcriptional regulator